MSTKDTILEHMGIGTVLKNRRKKVGFSLTQASKEIGISRRFLAKIEANTSPPKLATLRQMAKVYKTPIWVLMFFVDDGVEVVKELKALYKEIHTAFGHTVKEFL